MKKVLLTGDCIKRMKKIPDNVIDAVVTDPPYGLEFMGKEWDKFATLESFSDKEEGGFGGMKNHVRYGKDTKTFQQFTEQWAKECLRVLKPGGFLLAFGGTRTYHRLVCGIEDAGFEIRDIIAYMYGTGFPKSLNIGKAVDKLLGNERNNVGKNPNERLNKNLDKTVFNKRQECNITKGNSDWEGWGTALKPAMEIICVARKPLSEKNNALNVLKWGTGGLNIDACRIGYKSKEDFKQYKKDAEGINRQKTTKAIFDNSKIIGNHTIETQGRFPANIILDPEAAEELDRQSGITKSSMGSFKATDYNENETSTPFTRGDFKGKGDSGGASRFFYCAKPSKVERGTGNNHPTVKPIALMKYLVKLVSRENAIVLDPFLGSGTTGIAALELDRRFIGIEKSKEYMKIAKARVRLNLSQVPIGVPPLLQ